MTWFWINFELFTRQWFNNNRAMFQIKTPPPQKKETGSYSFDFSDGSKIHQSRINRGRATVLLWYAWSLWRNCVHCSLWRHIRTGRKQTAQRLFHDFLIFHLWSLQLYGRANVCPPKRSRYSVWSPHLHISRRTLLLGVLLWPRFEAIWRMLMGLQPLPV